MNLMYSVPGFIRPPPYAKLKWSFGAGWLVKQTIIRFYLSLVHDVEVYYMPNILFFVLVDTHWMLFVILVLNTPSTWQILLEKSYISHAEDTEYLC